MTVLLERSEVEDDTVSVSLSHRRFLKAVMDLDLLDNAFTHLDTFAIFEAIRTDPKNAQAGSGSRLDAKDFRMAMVSARRMRESASSWLASG